MKSLKGQMTYVNVPF